VLVSVACAAGHERWAEARAFFSAGDAHAEEVQALGAPFGLAALGVLEKGISAVDDDVAGRENRGEFLQHLVDRIAGFDHHEDAARRFESGGKILERFGADDFAVGVLRDKAVNPIGLEIPDGDFTAMIFDIECEVLPHDSEANNSELRSMGDYIGRHLQLLRINPSRIVGVRKS
jgi:hypothetical protein